MYDFGGMDKHLKSFRELTPQAACPQSVAFTAFTASASSDCAYSRSPLRPRFTALLLRFSAACSFGSVDCTIAFGRQCRRLSCITS